MLRIVRGFLAVAVACSLISGCGPQKLTRGLAKDILNKQGDLKQTNELTLSLDQLVSLAHLDKGAVDKVNTLIDMKSGRPCGSSTASAMVQVGQLPLCPGFIPPPVAAQKRGAEVHLTTPIGWKVVEITGVSDDAHAPNTKLVEYTWQYDLSTFPDTAAQTINPNPPAPGKAFLRLYDDGWRFESFTK